MRPRNCVCGCGKALEGRADQRFASEACRKRAKRRGGSVAAMSDGPEGRSTETVAAVRAQLEAAGRAETYLGAAALALAERIDNSTAVMGFAPLVKELRSTMDAALAGVKVAGDPVDELRARRDRKLAG